jgi:hypothetical protein
MTDRRNQSEKDFRELESALRAENLALKAQNAKLRHDVHELAHLVVETHSVLEDDLEDIYGRAG